LIFSVDTPRRLVVGDFAELFEDGFEVFDDFLGENTRLGKIVGFFEAFVSEKTPYAMIIDKIVEKKSQTPAWRRRMPCRPAIPPSLLFDFQ
jgi:hypothetical protein